MPKMISTRDRVARMIHEVNNFLAYLEKYTSAPLSFQIQTEDTGKLYDFVELYPDWFTQVLNGRIKAPAYELDSKINKELADIRLILESEKKRISDWLDETFPVSVALPFIWINPDGTQRIIWH